MPNSQYDVPEISSDAPITAQLNEKSPLDPEVAARLAKLETAVRGEPTTSGGHFVTPAHVLSEGGHTIVKAAVDLARGVEYGNAKFPLMARYTGEAFGKTPEPDEEDPDDLTPINEDTETPEFKRERDLENIAAKAPTPVKEPSIWDKLNNEAPEHAQPTHEPTEEDRSNAVKAMAARQELSKIQYAKQTKKLQAAVDDIDYQPSTIGSFGETLGGLWANKKTAVVDVGGTAATFALAGGLATPEAFGAGAIPAGIEGAKLGFSAYVGTTAAIQTTGQFMEDAGKWRLPYYQTADGKQLDPKDILKVLQDRQATAAQMAKGGFKGNSLDPHNIFESLTNSNRDVNPDELTADQIDSAAQSLGGSNKLDAGLVRSVAIILGAANGLAYGAAPMMALGEKSILGRLARAGGSNIMRAIILRPGASGVLIRVALGFMGQETVEAFNGALAELLRMIAEEVVTQNTKPQGGASGVAGRIVEGGINGAIQAAPISLIAAGGSGSRGKILMELSERAKVTGTPDIGIPDVTRMAVEASKRAAQASNLGEMAKSTVFQKNRSALKEFAERIANNGGFKSVTFPLDKLTDFFIKTGQDPKILMPDVAQQMEAAKGIKNAEIRVSPGDLAQYIAAHPSKFKELRKYMRHGPEGITLREAEELMEKAPLPPAPEQHPELKAIFDKVYDSLKGVGHTTLAPEAAMTVTSSINALATKLGMSPKQLFSQYPIKVIRESAESIKARTANEVSMPDHDPLEIPKGATTVDDKGITIALAADATTDTVMHEFGHALLHIWGKEFPENPDFKVAKALGDEGFANAFVEKLRSGRSPNKELRPAFDALHNWLTATYKGQRGTHLDPGVEAVLDRMLASQESMDRAKNLVTPMFDSPEAANMTPKQFDKYKQILADAAATARDATDRAQLEQINANGLRAFAEQVEKSRLAQIANNPMHSLVSWLETGKRLDGGRTPVMVDDLFHAGGKLSDKSLTQLGLKANDDIPHGPNGFDAAELSRAFGYNTAEFIDAYRAYKPLGIAAHQDAMDHMPGRVDDRKWLDNRAFDVVADDAIPRMLITEYKALGGKLNKVPDHVLIQTTRDIARAEIAKMQLSSLEPAHFFANSQKFGEAADNPSADSGVEASQYKIHQLLEFQRWREARRALEAQARFTSEAQRMAHDPEYLDMVNQNAGSAGGEAIRAMLGLYGFTPQTDFALGAYIRHIEAGGAAIEFDPKIDQRTPTPISNWTVSDLNDARDFMASLDHFFKTNTKYYGQEVDTVVSDINKQVSENFGGFKQPNPYTHEIFKEMKNWGLRLVSELTKPEDVFRILDKDEVNGPVARKVFQPIVEAAGFQEKMKQLYRRELEPQLKKLDYDRLSQQTQVSGETSDGKRYMRRNEVMAAILHQGTDTNAKALFNGNKISGDDHVNADGAWVKGVKNMPVLNRVEAEFINKQWAMMGSIFPDVQKAYLKETGTELKGISAKPFTLTLEDGSKMEMTGGYYPFSTPENSVGRWQKSGMISSADVKRDFTYSRDEHAEPLDLKLSVVMNHLDQRIHYATMTNALKEANKITTHPEFIKTINAAMGNDFNRTLRNWLDNAARDGMPNQPLSALDKVWRATITGGAQAAVGLNLKTVITRYEGLAPVLAYVKPEHMAGAIADFYRDMPGFMERAEGLSNELGRIEGDVGAHGWKLFLPDVAIGNSVQRQMQDVGRGKLFRTVADMQEYFQRLGTSQLAITHKALSSISFMAALETAKEAKHPDPIGFADAVQRQTQGGISMNDLPSLISRPGMARGTVMFYSHATVISSQMIRSGFSFANGWNTGGAKGLGNALLSNTLALTTMMVMPSVARYFLEQGYKDKPHDASQAGWLIRSQLAYLTQQSIPLAGHFLGSQFIPDAKHHFADTTPFGKAEEDAMKISKALYHGDADMKDASELASIFFQIPTNHMYQGIDYATSLAEGKFGNASNAWGVFMRGSKPHSNQAR